MTTSPSSLAVGVRCTPKIQDSGEMMSILISSLRSLFGELEPYSYDIKVEQQQQQQQQLHCDTNNKSDEDANNDFILRYDFIITCRPNKNNTVHAIRSALTMATTPSYFEPTNVYRFDTFIIEEEDHTHKKNLLLKKKKKR
jgi:hypothetical protein